MSHNISRNNLNRMTNVEIVQLLRDMNLPVVPVSDTTRNVIIQRIIRANQNPQYAEQVRRRQVRTSSSNRITRPFNQNQQRQGLFAYRVVMDDTNNTADVITLLNKLLIIFFHSFF